MGGLGGWAWGLSIQPRTQGLLLRGWARPDLLHLQALLSGNSLGSRQSQAQLPHKGH